MNHIVELQVCTTCLGENKEKLGAEFYAALQGRIDSSKIKLKPVECFSVCTRPATIAVSQPEKWTYLIADLNAETDIPDLLTYIDAYRASSNGRPPKSERPEVIQKGIVARLPYQKNE